MNPSPLPTPDVFDSILRLLFGTRAANYGFLGIHFDFAWQLEQD